MTELWYRPALTFSVEFIDKKGCAPNSKASSSRRTPEKQDGFENPSCEVSGLFLVVVCWCILLGCQQDSFAGQLHTVLVIDGDDLHFKRVANLADV